MPIELLQARDYVVTKKEISFLSGAIELWLNQLLHLTFTYNIAKALPVRLIDSIATVEQIQPKACVGGFPLSVGDVANQSSNYEWSKCDKV